MTENKYPVTEIIDTLRDFARLEMLIRKHLADGYQWSDAWRIGLEAFPVIEEVIADFDVFLTELGDVIPIESVAIFDGVKSGLTVEEQAKSRVLRVVKLVTQGHVYVDDLIDEAKAFYEKQRDRGLELRELAKHVVAKN